MDIRAPDSYVEGAYRVLATDPLAFAQVAQQIQANSGAAPVFAFMASASGCRDQSRRAQNSRLVEGGGPSGSLLNRIQEAPDTSRDIKEVGDDDMGGMDHDQGEERVPCAACHDTTHTLELCIWPDKDSGFVEGCPVCNSTGHVVDDCSRFGAMSLRAKVDLLVYDRLRMPSFAGREGWVPLLAKLLETDPGARKPEGLPWSAAHGLAVARWSTRQKSRMSMYYETNDPAYLSIDQNTRTWEVALETSGHRVNKGSQGGARRQKPQAKHAAPDPSIPHFSDLMRGLVSGQGGSSAPNLDYEQPDSRSY